MGGESREVKAFFNGNPAIREALAIAPRPTGRTFPRRFVRERAAESALHEDPGLSGLRISVATVRGIVQLRGVVEFPTQKARAEEIAHKIVGVKDVKNQITVYKVAKK